MNVSDKQVKELKTNIYNLIRCFEDDTGAEVHMIELLHSYTIDGKTDLVDCIIEVRTRK